MYVVYMYVAVALLVHVLIDRLAAAGVRSLGTCTLTEAAVIIGVRVRGAVDDEGRGAAGRRRLPSIRPMAGADVVVGVHVIVSIARAVARASTCNRQHCTCRGQSKYM